MRRVGQMEFITTTNATEFFGARVACPQADGHLIAGIADVRQGATVSAFGFGTGGATFGDRRVALAPKTRPAYYVPMHKSVTDVAHLRSGRPPV